MEEKLYFKPADYGAGKKKEKQRREQPDKADKKDRRALKLVIFLTFIALIILAILWLLRGKTTISGQFPANVRDESLVCESDKITYEKVNQINSENKNLKISMVFNGKESLKSADLKYTLTFGSYSEAYSAEAISHAQFGLGLQTLGFDLSKFSNKFSIIDNVLDISLHLSSEKGVDDATRSYFLINYKDDNSLPLDLSEYRQNYESQGFTCASTTEQQ